VAGKDGNFCHFCCFMDYQSDPRNRDLLKNGQPKELRADYKSFALRFFATTPRHIRQSTGKICPDQLRGTSGVPGEFHPRFDDLKETFKNVKRSVVGLRAEQAAFKRAKRTGPIYEAREAAGSSLLVSICRFTVAGIRSMCFL
jgi:hypothetical protein